MKYFHSQKSIQKSDTVSITIYRQTDGCAYKLYYTPGFNDGRKVHIIFNS